MKKNILVILATIPLLFSCNKNEKGFVDPFPEDDYNPIGFNFDRSESVSRPLTSTEQKSLEEMFEPEHYHNDDVMEHNVRIETRDYTRAFAGEFRQGYDSSNYYCHEDYKTFRQNDSIDFNRRTVTKGTIDTIYDYSYGRNKTDVKTTEWHYFATENADVYTEQPIRDAATHIISQLQVDAPSTDTRIGEILATKDGTWDDKEVNGVFSSGLEHSDFLIPLAERSSKPGADKDDNIILVKVSQAKYDNPDTEESEEGIYQLPDGRKYLAMQNSLMVSKLEKQQDNWYLVSYARKYNEITITSNEIQPNVPVEMLSNPIVIHYAEEIHNFSVHTIEISTEPIQNIVIAEGERL